MYSVSNNSSGPSFTSYKKCSTSVSVLVYYTAVRCYSVGVVFSVYLFTLFVGRTMQASRQGKHQQPESKLNAPVLDVAASKAMARAWAAVRSESTNRLLCCGLPTAIVSITGGLIRNGRGWGKGRGEAGEVGCVLCKQQISVCVLSNFRKSSITPIRTYIYTFKKRVVSWAHRR